MPDWTKSMTQTFEFFEVDPNTWMEKRQLEYMTSCSIDRDMSADTLGSASFECTELPDECYVRVYLITIQNGVRERFCFGTFLVQTPSKTFDGTITNMSVSAYTPLIELKEDMPDFGYTVPRDKNIMDNVGDLTSEHLRAPVVKTQYTKKLYSDYVADPKDTWLSYITTLMNNANYRFDLDEYSRVLFAPVQKYDVLQPVWTFDDDNSSILLPSITYKKDYYGIPNVVEIIYSDSLDYRHIIVKNEQDGSPTSIKNRGRIIKYRETNPSVGGYPSEAVLKKYAEELLETLSTIEVTVTFSHGYCPVRIGDCVTLNYKRAGIINTRAQITSQSIDCTPGCKVTETAVFKQKLYGG